MKQILFFSTLILLLTGVQALSLNEDIDLNSETVDDTLEETVDELDGDGSGAIDREKYILMIDRENYRPSALDQLGADIRYEYGIIDGVAVEVPEQALNGLSQLDFVESVEPDLVTSIPVIEASDSDEDTESYSGGEDIVISVLDTGIDDNHVDLQDQVLDHQDFTGTGPEDMHGHGTHVAGIASGTGEADSRHVGVAPETSLMNVKVLNDDGSGRVSDAIQGIDYSVENNADIIVMSLGVETECDGSEE